MTHSSSYALACPCLGDSCATSAHDINRSNDARTCPFLNRHLTSALLLAVEPQTLRAQLGRGGATRSVCNYPAGTPSKTRTRTWPSLLVLLTGSAGFRQTGDDNGSGICLRSLIQAAEVHLGVRPNARNTFCSEWSKLAATAYNSMIILLVFNCFSLFARNPLITQMSDLSREENI